MAIRAPDGANKQSIHTYTHTYTSFKNLYDRPLFLFIKSIPGAAVLQKQVLQIGKCTAGDLGAEGDMKDNLIEGGMKDLQN